MSGSARKRVLVRGGHDCHETQEKSIPKWRGDLFDRDRILRDSMIRVSLDIKCLRISSSGWKIR